MKINATDSSNAVGAIMRVMDKVEATAVKKAAVTLAASPAQLNRSYEVQQDPPVTVLKFINPSTKEVELQIPSAVSIKLYQEMQTYMERLIK